jgi:hypothetical protein
MSAIAQWIRLGLAEYRIDHGEQYLAWTELGRRFASYYERKMAEELAAGRPIPYQLKCFDKEGYALIDEEQ